MKKFCLAALAVLMMAGCSSSTTSSESSVASSTTASLSSAVSSSSNSSSSETSISTEEEATYMTITEKMLDNYIGNYTKAPLDEWHFGEFDDKGAVIITTHINLADSSENEPVVCIAHLDDDGDNFEGHYLSVGDTVYVDDGYADKALDEIKQYISETASD